MSARGKLQSARTVVEAKPRLAVAERPTPQGSPLSLVALSEAVRTLQQDARQRDEENQTQSEKLRSGLLDIKRRVMCLEGRCDKLVGEVTQLRTDMSKTAHDVENLRAGREHDSKALTLLEARAGDQSRQLGALQERHATLSRAVNDAELPEGQRRLAALVDELGQRHEEAINVRLHAERFPSGTFWAWANLPAGRLGRWRARRQLRCRWSVAAVIRGVRCMRRAGAAQDVG